MRTGDVGELPVAIELPSALELDVTLYVERELGWRRVPAAGPPAPALLLTQRPRPWPPSVLVTDGVADAGAVRAGLLQGAVDVVAWPDDRERLADCPVRLPAAAPAAAPATLVVSGAAGGVGASTVALALAGLAAWSGRRVVATGGEDLLRLAGVAVWDGPGADELARLAPADAAVEFGRVTRAVPGVAGLCVLHATGRAWGAGWPVDLLVVDGGVRPTVPGAAHGIAPGQATGSSVAAVVVARPDASLARVGRSAAPVLIVGEGPRSRAEVRRLLGREPLAWLPHSARVANAGCAGRVPAGLPGSWLAALARALRWAS